MQNDNYWIETSYLNFIKSFSNKNLFHFKNVSLNHDSINVNKRLDVILNDKIFTNCTQYLLMEKSVGMNKLIINYSDSTDSTNVSFYIKRLKRILSSTQSEEDISNNLKIIQKYLNDCSTEMSDEFNNPYNDGLNLLLTIANHFAESHKISLASLNCLRSFANSGNGLSTLIDNDKTYVFIAKCLKPKHVDLMHLAVEMLTFFFFYSSKTYQNVMHSLFQAAIFNNYNNRFYPLIEGVNNFNEYDEQDSLSLACIKLINNIINPIFIDNSEPLDKYYKMHLRYEFISFGLLDIFDELLMIDGLPFIHRQIQLFNEDYDNNYDEIDSYHKYTTKECNNNYELFRLVDQSIDPSINQSYLSNILSNLLLVVQDQTNGETLFELINKTITKITKSIRQKKNQEEIEENELLIDKIFIAEDLNDGLSYKRNDDYPKEELTTSLILNLESGNIFPDLNFPQNICINKSPDILETFGITRKVFQPQIAMKRANWNKINEEFINKSCFWVSLKTDNISNKALNELENDFSVKAGKFDIKKFQDVVASHNPRFLDMKNAQNISILLCSWKINFKEIKRAILELDESILTLSIIEQLIKYLPEQKEMQKLYKERNSYNDMSEPEQFCFNLSNIENIKNRLKSLEFKLIFDDKIDEVKTYYYEAEMTLNGILNSECFKVILGLILSLGNYMNSGSRNQQSIGFELCFLSKLSWLKNKTNSRSFIHLLADIVKNEYFDPQTLADQLSHIDNVNKIPIHAINTTFYEIKTDLKLLQNQLQSFNSSGENDKFFSIMTSFKEKVEEEILITEDCVKIMNSLFTSVADYYCFNTSSYTMEELFRDIFIFKNEFLSANKTNIESHINENHVTKTKLTTNEIQNKNNLNSITINDNKGLDNFLMDYKNNENVVRTKKDNVNSRRTFRDMNVYRSRRQCIAPINRKNN